MTPKELIYLASPYNHDDPAIRELRYLQCVATVGYLLHQKIWVYSPVVHNHLVTVTNDLGRDWKFWEEFDVTLLLRCDELRVLMLDNWENSVGVRAEIEWALKYNMRVSYMKLSEVPASFRMVRTEQTVRTVLGPKEDDSIKPGHYEDDPITARNTQGESRHYTETERGVYIEDTKRK